MVRDNVFVATCRKKFKNIHGKDINVKLCSTPNTVNIAILNTSITSVYYRSLVLLLINLVNFVCLYYNIIGVLICTAIFVISSILWYKVLGIVIEENVIVIKHLGYQIITKYILSKRKHFVPCNEIDQIFINEVIYQLKIVNVLTILTKETGNGNGKMKPLFTESLPRLQCLELIYKEIERL